MAFSKCKEIVVTLTNLEQKFVSISTIFLFLPVWEASTVCHRASSYTADVNVCKYLVSTLFNGLLETFS